MIRALERPAECRESRAGGERMDHVDSDDDDDDHLFLFSRFAAVHIEGNSSSGRIRARAPE